MHAVPHRRGARGRGDRQDHRESGPVAKPRVARRPLRADGGRFALRAGWPDAKPRPERDPPFPGRFQQAGASAARAGLRTRYFETRRGVAAMALIQEIDYGTPARFSPTSVTLEIDGKPVTVPA